MEGKLRGRRGLEGKWGGGSGNEGKWVGRVFGRERERAWKTECGRENLGESVGE